MHEHVEINCSVKDIWLKCMSSAIDGTDISASTKDKLMSNFTVVAERLVNTGRVN